MRSSLQSTIPRLRPDASAGSSGARLLPLVLALIAVGAVACGGARAQRPEAGAARGGVIESIAQISRRQFSALTGMLVGGVLGNSGCGTENRRVGLALSALGGAWAVGSAGHGVPDEGYWVTVRMMAAAATLTAGTP